VKTERIKGWLDDPELELLLARAEPALALAICLMADAGCRLREALAFDPRSLSGSMLRIWSTKTDSWRTVPLTPRLSAAIDRALGATVTDDRIVEVNRKLDVPHLPLIAAALSPRTVQRRLHQVVALSGTQLTTPHRLRHSYASRLSAEGVPIHVISALLGHRSLAVTLLYIHGGKDEYAQAAIALDRRRKQALANPRKSGRIKAGSGPARPRRSRQANPSGEA
jgi:integrase